MSQHFLLTKFLTDPDQYEAAKAHWYEEVHALNNAAIQRVSLRPWFAAPTWDFINSSHESSTNIFSVVAENLRRGVAITQWDISAEGNDLEAWVDSFGDPSCPADLIQRLQIHCKLSKETTEIAKTLIHAWLLDQSSSSYMESLITQHGWDHWRDMRGIEPA